jgi:hypothetical protein
LIKREKSKRFAVIITFFLWFGFGTDAERRARGFTKIPMDFLPVQSLNSPDQPGLKKIGQICAALFSQNTKTTFFNSILIYREKRS